MMKKRNLIILILVSIIILCIIVIGIKVKSKDDLVEHLKDHIIPIETTRANNGFEDLMPLKDILKDRKIIGMGESTHGTAEFFQMKHRMFEFLVEEMGFRLFVMEVQFGDGQVVNDYIVNGKGTLADCSVALKQWTAKSNEVLDMIQWMRDFNVGKGIEDKVKFYGYDMQGIDGNLSQIVPYIKKVNSKVKMDNDNLRDFYNPFYTPKDNEIEILSKDTDKLYSDMVANKDNYIKMTGKEKYEIVLQNIEIVRQWINFTKENNFHKMFHLRESYAAENIRWISNYENEKIMLWAHNGHIGNSYKKTYIFDKKIESLGEILKNIYNDNYYSIGFDFYKGSFTAVVQDDLSKNYLKSSQKDSFAYKMMKTDIPIGFLDINHAKEDKVLADFISSAIHINLIGAEYLGTVIRNPRILEDTFDGIIFVKTTSASEFAEGLVLKDGNRTLIISSGIKLLIMIILLILSLKAFDNRLPTRAKIDSYDIMGELNKKTKNNLFKHLLLRLGEYTHSISSFKYSVLTILALSFLMIITNYINPLHIFHVGYGNYEISKIVLNLVLSTIFMILIFMLSYILPLIVIKKVHKDKKIFFKQVCFVSLLGAVLYASTNMLIVNVFLKEILYTGETLNIMIYLLNILLGVVMGLIICYSFTLFSSKWEKPILNLFIIVFIQRLIIFMFEVLVFIVKLL